MILLAISLIVVALAGGVGAGSLARQGHVCWRFAFTFSAPAAAGALLGAVANTAVSGRGFALVVTAVAAFLLIDTVLLGGPPGN